jgi:Beta-galactosidase
MAALATRLALPILSELRLRRAAALSTDRWRALPVAARHKTELGVSFRPPQVDALGLDARSTFNQILNYPFALIRLGAYWNRIERARGEFDPSELDWQVDAAERAGKRIFLCVGPLKTFGYPEFFVPAHHLQEPLREGILVRPETHQPLLAAAIEFVTRIVERYRGRTAIVAWQVEHEAVDPLGVEHSWRLSAGFVKAEVDAVRNADPTRPIMMNGFLPTSTPVRLQQWWSTRDQGDSLAIAQQLADVVGIDYYPRHALLGLGATSVYLQGEDVAANQRRRQELFLWARTHGKRLMISEGQAEPWEAVTVPPSPPGRSMYSCTPKVVIENYNRCIGWARDADFDLDAYIFWGAEYWITRQRSGDSRYLDAVARILSES